MRFGDASARISAIARRVPDSAEGWKVQEGRFAARGRAAWRGMMKDARSWSDRLVGGSPDGLFAVSLEGRILSWNRGAQTIFGYTPEEAIGQLIDELLVPEEHRAE